MEHDSSAGKTHYALLKRPFKFALSVMDLFGLYVFILSERERAFVLSSERQDCVCICF